MSDASTPPAPPIPLPLHAASHDAGGEKLTVKRRPGRPRKIFLAPVMDADESDYVAQMSVARDHHIGNDALVGAVGGKADADRILREVIRGLAIESASLSWETMIGREAGKDTAQGSSRRIDALSKIALVELGRHKLGMVDELNPRDPRMDAIVGFFVRTVRDVIESTLPADTSSLVMAAIVGSLRAWQESGEPGSSTRTARGDEMTKGSNASG